MSSLPPPCANSHVTSIKPPRLPGRGFRLLALTFWETEISGCLMGHGKCLTALEDTGFRVSTASQRVSPASIREIII